MNKVAIVTGGGNGIGEATVRHLASQGYVTIALDRDAVAAAHVVSDVAAAGHVAHAIACDITDYPAAKAAVDAIATAHGGPWLLVNNVGGDRPAPFAGSDPEDWRALVDVNLFTMLNMVHAVLPHMEKAGGGRIVNVSSDSARFGVPNVAVYAACKGGMISFAKCLAKEVADRNILINTICPGSTDTPALRTVMDAPGGRQWVDTIIAQIPLRRIAVPDDYPPMIALLAGRGGDYMTGQTISINGGKSMV